MQMFFSDHFTISGFALKFYFSICDISGLFVVCYQIKIFNFTVGELSDFQIKH